MMPVANSLSQRLTRKRTKASRVLVLGHTHLGCRPLLGKRCGIVCMWRTIIADFVLQIMACRGTGFSSRFGKASQRTALRGESLVAASSHAERHKLVILSPIALNATTGWQEETSQDLDLTKMQSSHHVSPGVSRATAVPQLRLSIQSEGICLCCCSSYHLTLCSAELCCHATYMHV